MARAPIPTAHDIAASCGVSRPVVSAILRGSNSYSIRYGEETKARVLAAAAKLGYRPHRNSRTLAMRRQGSIGILVNSLYVLSRGTLQAIHNEAAMGGNLLVIEHVNGDGTQMPAIVREHSVDGIIVVNDVSPHVEREILRLRIPVVWANTNRTRGKGVITYDEAGGMELAVRHLKACGRRHLLYLHPRSRSHYSTPAREEGLRHAARCHGLPKPAIAVYDVPKNLNTPEGTLALIAQQAAILRAHGAVDGVIAHGLNAPRVVRAARDLGLRVPEDLAVVAFGGEHDLTQLSPMFTAVEVPHVNVGELAVQTLDRIIAGGNVRTITVPYHIITSESTGSWQP